jgi:hypothetical protein
LESYYEGDGKENCGSLLCLDGSQRLLEEIGDEEVSVEVAVGEEFAEGVVEAVVEIVFEFIEYIIAMEKTAK